MLDKRSSEQWWIEPFVGGGNLIDKVDGDRLGSDLDVYTIEALIAIRDCVGDLPKDNTEFTEVDYRNLKTEGYKYKGYAGYAFSYGGKWMGGWGRDREGRRDYVREAYLNEVKQSPGLKGVKLVNFSYQELEIPSGSLIYCDPPYKGTTKYKNLFNHDDFWQWCRVKAQEGHTVFISEYNYQII